MIIKGVLKILENVDNDTQPARGPDMRELFYVFVEGSQNVYATLQDTHEEAVVHFIESMDNDNSYIDFMPLVNGDIISVKEINNKEVIKKYVYKDGKAEEISADSSQGEKHV